MAEETQGMDTAEDAEPVYVVSHDNVGPWQRGQEIGHRVLMRALGGYYEEEAQESFDRLLRIGAIAKKGATQNVTQDVSGKTDDAAEPQAVALNETGLITKTPAGAPLIEGTTGAAPEPESKVPDTTPVKAAVAPAAPPVPPAASTPASGTTSAAAPASSPPGGAAA